MPSFSFYPTREDGIALTFETRDFDDRSSAISFARSLFLHHGIACEILVFLEWPEPEIVRVQRSKAHFERDVDKVDHKLRQS